MNSKMKEILQALIDGEPIESATVGVWTTSTTSSTLSVLSQWAFGHTSVDLRVQRQMIQIGEFKVPAPLRKPPLGVYYYANPPYGEVAQLTWGGTDVEILWLANGALHATKQGAELFLAAILSQTKEQK